MSYLRPITKALGKGFMIALESGVILDAIAWLGMRRDKKRKQKQLEIEEARRRAHR